MPHPFDSPSEAYKAAWEAVKCRQGGRSNTLTDDHGGGGPSKDYRWLTVLEVWIIAEVHDPGYREHDHAFELWFCPPPTLPRPEWTVKEERRISEAASRFGCHLCEKQFIPPCGNRCRKQLTRG